MKIGRSERNPENSLPGALLCAVLAVLAYFVATGDAEQISNALSGAATAVSRSASIYAPEIIGSAGFAADFFKDAAVSVDYQEILKDAGLLAGTGLVLKVAYDEVKNKYKSLDYSDKKKLKQGAALAVIACAILSSGCINSLKPDADGDGYADDVDDFPNDPRYHSDYDGDGYADEIDDLPHLHKYHIDSDGDGAADEIDAFPNDSRYREDSDGDGYADEIDSYPDDANAHEKSWWNDLNHEYGYHHCNNMYMYPGIIQPKGNLFGVEIRGIVQFSGLDIGHGESCIGIEELENLHLLNSDVSGCCIVWNETRKFGDNRDIIFEHRLIVGGRYRSLDKTLALDLLPEQYKALTSEYGQPRHIILEQYDTTGNGEFDKVVLRYDGTKGSFNTCYRFSGWNMDAPSSIIYAYYKYPEIGKKYYYSHPQSSAEFVMEKIY